MTPQIRKLSRLWTGAIMLTAGVMSAANTRAAEENPCPPAPSVFRGGPAAPDKVSHVDPRFPTRSTPTSIGEVLWIGELEVDVDGRVRSVNVLRRVSISPPWPEWERAIPAAVRKWRYAVPCVMGKPQRLRIVVVFDPIRREFRGEQKRTE
jgi:hypothetical protein